MTDGDIIYENEFVALPPKSRRSNRKRNAVSKKLVIDFPDFDPKNSLYDFSQVKSFN